MSPATILSGDYGKSARADRIAAYVDYALGAGIGIAGISLVLFAFGDIRDVLSWPQVVLKLGLTAAAGGLTAVAFRFGGQALRRSTSFRRQELELRALEPILRDVKESDSAVVAFVARSFGHSWVAENREPVDTAEPVQNR